MKYHSAHSNIIGFGDVQVNWNWLVVVKSIMGCSDTYSWQCNKMSNCTSCTQTFNICTFRLSLKMSEMIIWKHVCLQPNCYTLGTLSTTLICCMQSLYSWKRTYHWLICNIPKEDVQIIINAPLWEGPKYMKYPKQLSIFNQI